MPRRSLPEQVVASSGIAQIPEQLPAARSKTEGLLLPSDHPGDNRIGYEMQPTPLAAALCVALPTHLNTAFRCESTQYIWLGLTVLIGILLGFHHSELDFFSTFFQLWLGHKSKYSTSDPVAHLSTILWIGALLLAFLDFHDVGSGKPTQCCNEVRACSQGWWNLHYSAGASGFGSLQLFFTVSGSWQISIPLLLLSKDGVNYYPLRPRLLVGDGVPCGSTFCFCSGCPQLLASPRTYRFVVPRCRPLLLGEGV